jgi:hypothetical protein
MNIENSAQEQETKPEEKKEVPEQKESETKPE